MLQKSGGAVAQSAIHGFRLLWQLCRRTGGDDAVCFCIPGEFQKGIGIHGRRGYQTAVTVIGGAAAVIGEDVLAVVLDAYVVAINKRNADAQGSTADDNFQRLQCFADARTFFGTELLQAVKMTAVIKFAVIWQRILDEEAASLITTNRLAVLAGKGGVVLAHASVLVELAGFCGNAAENYTDIFGGSDNFFGIIGAVIQKGLLLPDVADKITRQCHFGQKQDIGLKAACFFNSVNDFLIVYIRTAGSNFQLSADNFQLQFIVLTILFAFYITIVLL